MMKLLEFIVYYDSLLLVTSLGYNLCFILLNIIASYN